MVNNSHDSMSLQVFVKVSPSSIMTSTIAEYPFNDSSADLTLRSSEGTSFLVRRSMISLASPVFDDMFGLPLVGDNEHSERLVIDLPETNRELRLLLEWCDPRVIPQCPLPFLDIPDLLRVADKYQVSSIPYRVLPQLSHYIPQQPFRIYLIACRYLSVSGPIGQFVLTLAKESAKKWVAQKAHPSMNYPELEFVSAKRLQALYIYRDTCSSVIRPRADNNAWIIQRVAGWIECTCCRSASVTANEWNEERDDVDEWEVDIPEWFAAYLSAFGDKIADSPTLSIGLDAVQSEDFWRYTIADGVGQCQRSEDMALLVNMAIFHSALAKRVVEIVNNVCHHKLVRDGY
jgi:hypothetical protein